VEDEVSRTIKTYDDGAEKYSKVNYCITPIRYALDLFVESIGRGKILDAGCGHGRDARHLSELGFHIVGIDLSQGLLEIARRSAAIPSFCLMDLRKLGFLQGSFEGVWACASLLHLPKREAEPALREIRGILKPGGLIFTSLKVGEGENFVKAQEYGDKERFYAFYSMEEARKLFEEAGFEIMEDLIEKSNGKNPAWINIFARALTLK
jgi:SAM-dependent methyltransferase